MKPTLRTDKFVPFFSVVVSRTFMELFERAEIQNVLISYHYIRKYPDQVERYLKKIREWGGLFMTDSGAFSFFNDKNFNPDTFDWNSYLQEYTDWLDAHSDYVYTACNLDVDALVGHRQVQQWNKDYFEPLEEKMNIAYVAHSIKASDGSDLDMVKEYTQKYNYVAVSEEYRDNVSAIYQLAKKNKCAIHGLAWTKPTVLRDYPFHSGDSSSWVNYQKFGTTHFWDGVNFSQHDGQNKHIRQQLRAQCEKYGVDFKTFCTEKDAEGNYNASEGLVFSLKAWADVLETVKDRAKLKLNITVADMLEGKDCIFEQKGSQLAALFENAEEKGLAIREEKQETDAEGNAVALYEPREVADRTKIQTFEEQMGSTMFCDNCFIADKCPKYKKRSACAFEFSLSQEQMNPLQMLDFMIAKQSERVNRSFFMEKMEGGLPNKTYTQELQVLNRLNTEKANMIMNAKRQGVKISLMVEGDMGMSEGDEGQPVKKPGVMDILGEFMRGQK